MLVNLGVDCLTRVLVQGITGRAGKIHTKECLAYGTRIVGGVVPGKEGEVIEGVPVFSTVARAKEKVGGDATIIFVPPMHAAKAIEEAIEAQIPLIVCITEGIPLHDLLRVHRKLEKNPGITLLGPNSPGLIVPGECKLGIMPAKIFKKGRVGIISRSGTLTYEAVLQTSSIGLGQSICIGLGGDLMPGIHFKDALAYLEKDPSTEVILLVGEIGGISEEEGAEWIASFGKKPVAALIAGVSAPKDQKMGHAGALILRGRGSASEKIDLLRRAGALIVNSIAEIGISVKRALEEREKECVFH